MAGTERASQGRGWTKIVQLRRELDECAAARTRAQARVRELEVELDATRQQLAEALKLVDLQQADLERYRQVVEAQPPPHRPEHVPREQLQLAFERILAAMGDLPAANDVAHAEPDENQPAPAAPARRRRHRHGRRNLDLTKLPVHTISIEPPEVLADPEAWVRIGEEVGERVAFRRGQHVRVKMVRGKWVRREQLTASQAQCSAGEALDGDEQAGRPIVVAPLPPSVWPGFMADPSALAHLIVSKYDDLLPLNRQERMSRRDGFELPRSTQGGWLGASYQVLYRLVDAMFEQGKRESFCIATDSTGAPVRAAGEFQRWHVFVFITDHDHVVFRHSAEQNSDTIRELLQGYRGHLLLDAASIYDGLFRDGAMTEVACWAHQRRYVWRALETDRERALEGLALIGKLFAVERHCRSLPMPARTAERAARAGPILELFEAWVDRHRGRVDPRGPLDRAIGYYDNQRDALRRFLADGRLSIHNNLCEGALRSLVLGRANWRFFAHETGLRWYTTFRSLIASCYLHGLEPQDYLEQVLRLAPHWRTSRLVELAPKHWQATLARLGAQERAMLQPPWASRLSSAQAPLEAAVPAASELDLPPPPVRAAVGQ